MELTNELKEKLAKCATVEEAKAVLDAAGVALSDDELAAIAGGDSGFLYTIMAAGKTYKGFTESPDPDKYPVPIFGG